MAKSRVTSIEIRISERELLEMFIEKGLMSKEVLEDTDFSLDSSFDHDSDEYSLTFDWDYNNR